MCERPTCGVRSWFIFHFSFGCRRVASAHRTTFYILVMHLTHILCSWWIAAMCCGRRWRRRRWNCQKLMSFVSIYDDRWIDGRSDGINRQVHFSSPWGFTHLSDWEELCDPSAIVPMFNERNEIRNYQRFALAFSGTSHYSRIQLICVTCNRFQLPSRFFLSFHAHNKNPFAI